mgnify:CR=1 FL=1
MEPLAPLAPLEPLEPLECWRGWGILSLYEGLKLPWRLRRLLTVSRFQRFQWC